MENKSCSHKLLKFPRDEDYMNKETKQRDLFQNFICKDNWCNILINYHFQVHMRGEHKWNSHLSMPQEGLHSTYLACTVQPRGHTGMGQVFTFAGMRWWNIVQVRMLHQYSCFGQFLGIMTTSYLLPSKEKNFMRQIESSKEFLFISSSWKISIAQENRQWWI